MFSDYGARPRPRRVARNGSCSAISGIARKSMTARKSSNTDSSGGAEGRARVNPFGEDWGFQVREWRLERIGWAVMVVIIVAALSGVLGGGGLVARTTVADAAGSTEVRYARFARYASPTTLHINLAASASGRPIRLRVSDRYLSEMNVRAITPLPTSTAIADRQHVFVFERSAQPTSATIRFELEPTAVGRHLGWIAVDEAAPLSFTQFIYP